MNSDFIIVGKDLPAFIYGMKLLGKDKTVHIVNDHEILYPNFFMNTLGSLETSMIENLGKTSSIRTLENIKKYLSPKEVIFSINNKKLLTGGGPASVLLELFRKLPFLFNSSSFMNNYITQLKDKAYCIKLNQDFEVYNRLLGKQLSLYSSRQSYTLKLLIENCPKLLKELFVLFSNIVSGNVKISEREMICFKSLLSSLKLIFQTDFSFNNNDFELFNLVNSLLTQNYVVNYNSLLKDLNNEFINSGGRYTEGRITDWIPSRKTWELEIEKSGSISCPSLIIAGDWPEHYPLHFKKDPQSFSAITVCAESISSLNDYTYIINDAANSDINFPVSLFEMKGHSINVTYFIPSEVGCNIHLDKNLYLDQFYNDISNLIAANVNKIKISNIIKSGKIKGSFSHNKFLSKVRKIRFEKKSSIYLQDLDETNKKSKYLSYLGPLDRRGSGGIFLLGIINDEIDFI